MSTNTPMERGQIERSRIQQHLGIRFADAERFAPPRDRDDAPTGAFGARAPQAPSALDQMLGGNELPMSEDCLFLNVYTPAADGRARPVLVWVHGGAFITGTAGMPWYDGSGLAARGDAVVVTVNYRLGALGFLGTANLGVLDQVSALRWVQRNIAAYGGDPGDVTIFGESAGGSSLIALLATPSADDLFHRVWAMSPSLPQLRTADDATSARSTYVDLLGLASSATDDEMMNLDLDVLLDAQTRMPATGVGLKNFSPTDATETIPASILETAAADPRPIVIGTNRDEMLLFTAFDASRSAWTEADVEREFGHRFPDATAAAIAAYRAARPDSSPSQLVSAMQTDEMFRTPAQRLAATRPHATWMYGFDYPSMAFGGVLGCCHGLDIPFVFDNVDQPGASMFIGAGVATGVDVQTVADQFARALVSFIRDGDPGWAEYDTSTRATQRIGLDPHLVKDPEQDLRELWE